MIGTKIVLLGLILLVVGAALYFVAMGETRVNAPSGTVYDVCTSEHGADFPECAAMRQAQDDNPLRLWGFIIGAVGAAIIAIGILTMMLFHRGHKEKPVAMVVEKVVYKCSKCGAENSTNDEFCKKCGNSMKAPKPPMPATVTKVLYKCRKCGSENSTNDEFCKKCGYPLKKASN